MSHRKKVYNSQPVTENDKVDYFALLGDNFYDQDGRLTRAIWDQLSIQTKSVMLQTVPGNHDHWICGGPACGDEYDQSSHGLMQFYAQDPVASVLSTVL